LSAKDVSSTEWGKGPTTSGEPRLTMSQYKNYMCCEKVKNAKEKEQKRRRNKQQKQRENTHTHTHKKKKKHM
jgi:hypothetical protein